MRPLILYIILLASAICSCRSQQHIAEKTAETTVVAVEQHAERSGADELIAAIRSQSDLTLSDINITFFPPDSAHPDARAAPASLTIGRVNSKKNTDSDIQHKAESTENETVNLVAKSDTEKSVATDKEVNALSPPSSVLTIILLALIVIAFIAYTVYRIRSPTK